MVDLLLGGCHTYSAHAGVRRAPSTKLTFDYISDTSPSWSSCTVKQQVTQPFTFGRTWSRSGAGAAGASPNVGECPGNSESGRTRVGGVCCRHFVVSWCGARRRRPGTSPLPSEWRSYSNGHNGPAGELVKRRIREPIIYSHTMHGRGASLGRGAGVMCARAASRHIPILSTHPRSRDGESTHLEPSRI